MTTRYTRQSQTPQLLIQLPLLAQVALYAPEISQVDELIHLAHSLGYSTEQINVFQESKAAATPLKDRFGYKQLLTAMREGVVSVLFLKDSKRLFAGIDEATLNAFLHLCMDKGIFVITHERVYDLSNLTLVHQFRIDSTERNQCFSS